MLTHNNPIAHQQPWSSTSKATGRRSPKQTDLIQLSWHARIPLEKNLHCAPTHVRKHRLISVVRPQSLHCCRPLAPKRQPVPNVVMQYVVNQHYKLEVTICQYMDQLPAMCTGLHTLYIERSQHVAKSNSQISIYGFRAVAKALKPQEHEQSNTMIQQFRLSPLLSMTCCYCRLVQHVLLVQQ